MKGNMIPSLWDHDGEVIWVEFASADDVTCGFEEGPSTVIDNLVQQYQSGCYRVQGDKLISCTDSSKVVFAYNTMISGFYAWSEENQNQAVQAQFEQFRAIEAELHAYAYACNVIYVDSVTVAPSDSHEDRGNVMGILSGLQYEKMTCEETQSLVRALLAQPEALTPAQLREAEVFNRENEYVAGIPKEEYVAYSTLLTKAETVWHQAKKENDFAAFAPYLQEIVDTNRKFALYYRPNQQPYDTLLDQYERGLNMETADRFFDLLRTRITALVQKIQAKPQVDDSFLHQHYPIEKQRLFSAYLMEVMGINPTHCTLGETEHPFTQELNKKDVRITTHYYENAVESAMFSVIHEGGHALYELNGGDEYEGTVLSGGVSMGIHESQSRLYENLIGRSRAFTGLIFPKMQELFPEQLAGKTAEDFYRAVNKSEPSLIRTEADELTYALHVLVRYELEKGLIGGTVAVADLPRLWNEKMQTYLGVTVPNDTCGVLQDSHWSGGAIGYFPSYALGSAYGVQIMAKMRESLDVDKAVSEGNLPAVTAWLTEHLYRHSSRYEPKELFEQCCGAPFDPEYFVAYLERKYSEIYSLS